MYSSSSTSTFYSHSSRLAPSARSAYASLMRVYRFAHPLNPRSLASCFAFALLLVGDFARRCSRETNRCADLAYAKSRATSEPVDCSFGSVLCSVVLFGLLIPGRPAGAVLHTQRYATLPKEQLHSLRSLYSPPAHTTVHWLELPSETKGPQARQCAYRQLFAACQHRGASAPRSGIERAEGRTGRRTQQRLELLRIL